MAASWTAADLVQVDRLSVARGDRSPRRAARIGHRARRRHRGSSLGQYCRRTVFCAAGAARQHCFDERGGAREARHTRFHDRRPQDRRANDGELAMNGVHDCGGMQCYGPIQYTPSEPPFHATWEARVLAMTFGTWYAHNVGIPTFRADIEALPPVDYLRMS